MIANHPERDQIRLENVLVAIGHPLRLAVLSVLAGGGEHACGTILDGVSKSTLTHHWRVLRDSGLIWQRPYGRENLLSLRTEDIETRFPGLLPAVLSSLKTDAVTVETINSHLRLDVPPPLAKVNA